MAQGGNGVDIGAVYQLLVQVSGRLDSHERKLDDLVVGLADLRATVTNYHSAVLGHGILISELDERIRRIERHLKLESIEG